METVQIKKISPIRNIRTEIGDVSSLMTSIREHGLLEPIGVYKDKENYILVYGHRRFQALKKLGRKQLKIGNEVIIKDKLDLIDLVVTNLVENEQREDVSPIEFAKVCSDLREMGLSLGEISARLNESKNRIKSSLVLLEGVPKEHRKRVSYIKISEVNKKNGRLPATVASTIMFHKARYALKDKDVKQLFNLARENELSTRDIRFLGICMQDGKTLKESINLSKKFQAKNVDLIINKEEFSKIDIPFRDYLKEVLVGKRQFNKNLFY